jgi:hypothetical protein
MYSSITGLKEQDFKAIVFSKSEEGVKMLLLLNIKYTLFTVSVCLSKLHLNHTAILATSALSHLEYLGLIIILAFSNLIKNYIKNSQDNYASNSA